MSKKKKIYKARYWLTFDGKRSREPIIYKLSKKFDVIFNIRQATINDTLGLMAVEFEGDEATVLKAIDWLTDEGIHVDPIEINTIEG